MRSISAGVPSGGVRLVGDPSGQRDQWRPQM